MHVVSPRAHQTTRGRRARGQRPHRRRRDRHRRARSRRTPRQMADSLAGLVPRAGGWPSCTATARRSETWRSSRTRRTGLVPAQPLHQLVRDDPGSARWRAGPRDRPRAAAPARPSRSSPTCRSTPPTRRSPSPPSRSGRSSARERAAALARHARLAGRRGRRARATAGWSPRRRRSTSSRSRPSARCSTPGTSSLAAGGGGVAVSLGRRRRRDRRGRCHRQGPAAASAGHRARRQRAVPAHRRRHRPARLRHRRTSDPSTTCPPTRPSGTWPSRPVPGRQHGPQGRGGPAVPARAAASGRSSPRAERWLLSLAGDAGVRHTHRAEPAAVASARRDASGRTRPPRHLPRLPAADVGHGRRWRSAPVWSGPVPSWLPRAVWRSCAGGGFVGDELSAATRTTWCSPSWAPTRQPWTPRWTPGWQAAFAEREPSTRQAP